MGRRPRPAAGADCILSRMRTPLSRRRFLKLTAAGLSGAAVPATAHAREPIAPDEFTVAVPVSLEVNARPIPFFDTSDRARVRFGALEYRSGLILTSRFRGFGGISGFRLDPKGERFIAVSDRASWFTGRIVYHGREMTGLDDVEAAPLLGPDGRPITARGWYDSESLALDGSVVYVGIERVHRVLRYDFAKGFTRSRGEEVPLPPAWRKQLPSNKGLEALTVVPKGFLIGGKTPGQFSIRRTDKFDISDGVLLPSGDLLVLERKFSWLSGIGIRIRRLPLKALAPGAVVDGPAIFEADLGQEVDNMEAIDAHVTPEGDTVLTLLSDDNFSMIQRNLILQFTLKE
jgi:hypothetical protein